MRGGVQLSSGATQFAWPVLLCLHVTCGCALGVCVQVLGGASGGVWSEGKEKADAAAQPSTWNVDVFVQVVKELVSCTTHDAPIRMTDLGLVWPLSRTSRV